MMMHLPPWPEPERWMFDSNSAYLMARNNYLKYEERRRKQHRFHIVCMSILLCFVGAIALTAVIGVGYLLFKTIEMSA